MSILWTIAEGEKMKEAFERLKKELQDEKEKNALIKLMAREKIEFIKRELEKLISNIDLLLRDEEL